MMGQGSDICPDCGARLSPDGACYQCMLQLGLGGSDETPTDGAGAGGGGLGRLGDYELLEEIGRGGMGRVFRAQQVSLNRDVALKVISTGTFATPAMVASFRSESEAAAGMDHPNVVPVHEVGEAGGQLYLSMRLIEGGTLAGWAAEGAAAEGWRGKRGWLKDTASLVAKIADAVAYAHRRGILHRDIKPGNILLSSDGEPFLSDFGLAKALEDGGDLTKTLDVLGTPAYMSPEQAAGNTRDLTTAVDVYGLGAVLYEILTGRAPFDGRSLVEILNQVASADPPRPSLSNPGVDRDLDTICGKCLEKDPRQRYDSAQALADDLRRWVRDEPILARRAGVGERLVKFARRRPGLIAAGGALALTGLIGFCGVLWQWRRAEFQKENAIAAQESSERAAYARDVYAASRILSDGNIRLARRFLEPYLPDAGAGDLRGPEWFYLIPLTDGGQQFSLDAHRDRVCDLAFSRDGKLLASVSWDGAANLWDLDSQQLLHRFGEHSGQLHSVAFSHDGALVATCGNDLRLNLWTLEDFELLSRDMGGTDVGFVGSLEFSPCDEWLLKGIGAAIGVGEGGNSRMSRFREELLKGGTRIQLGAPKTFGGHSAFSFDGRLAVTAGDGDGFAIWETGIGGEAEEVAGFGRYDTPLRVVKNGRYVIALDSSPNDESFIFSHSDGSIEIWDARSGLRRQVL
ncbi:MAG: WD40 repeat domain-containing serine/threonine protein kinase, partial [Verrucomicrobiales bacterium]